WSGNSDHGGGGGSGGLGISGAGETNSLGHGSGGDLMASNGGSERGGGGDAGSITGGASAVGGTISGTVNASGGGVAAQGGVVTFAGAGPCGIPPNPTGDPSQHRMVLRDAGVNRLAYIDVAHSANSWVVPLERELESGVVGRDMQLVGSCKLLVGTDVGYEEYDLRTGKKVGELSSFPGTFSAQRLRNRNTVLVGVGTDAAPYQSSVGIVLIEIDASGTPVSKTIYPGTFVRLVRPTSNGTFLVANNTRVFEGDTVGNILPITFTPPTSALQVWKALRVSTTITDSPETVVSTGFGASLAIFRADGSFRRNIGGGTAAIVGGATAVDPYFFAGFQVLKNGNFIVANFRGSGAGNFSKGIPVLEYTPANALAWYWGDPAYADRLSSIQEVIVVDNLDLTKLHVEDTVGQQVPVDP
ncbi:MAG TPA: hypothetical protein VIV60_26190, partial [Polyangiaceae bacterium]